MAFPYHKQEKNHTCGAASMRTVLENLGIKKSEKQVSNFLKTNKVRGTWLKAFPLVAEKFKLDYVVMRNASIGDLRRCLKEGHTILLAYFYPPEKVDHYSVVRKIDSRFIHFWDPWFGPEHKYSLSYFKMSKIFHQFVTGG